MSVDPVTDCARDFSGTETGLVVGYFSQLALFDAVPSERFFKQDLEEVRVEIFFGILW